MKIVTVTVTVEVRKTGPDEYQYRDPAEMWTYSESEAYWRRATTPGARAILTAIDSGAFVDPLPTAVGAVVVIDGVTFVLTDDGGAYRPWISARAVKNLYWHTAAQVQSYGEFRVLWDGEKGEANDE